MLKNYNADHHHQQNISLNTSIEISGALTSAGIYLKVDL